MNVIAKLTGDRAESNKSTSPRIVLEYSENRIKELENLQKKLDLSTRKELFNYALGMLEWAVKQREQGYVVMVGNHEIPRYIEISMPALDRIKPIQHRQLEAVD
ncbi:MAG: hypothetical protein HOP03_03695 [Lysobacter sp.]|nr:hypothetical protein [Lysobacter sp.]